MLLQFPRGSVQVASAGLEDFHLALPLELVLLKTRSAMVFTCGAPLEPCTVGRHQGRIPRLSRLPNAHFEGASNHVAPVEFDINCVDAILMGDEANSILI